MANRITQLIVGAGLAAAIIGSIVLARHRPNDDVAFLERLAATVEQAKVLAPDTREYVSELAGRYETRLADARLDLRRQKALARIMAVLRPTGVASDGFSTTR
jgi:hypothetical protein